MRIWFVWGFLNIRVFVIHKNIHRNSKQHKIKKCWTCNFLQNTKHVFITAKTGFNNEIPLYCLMHLYQEFFQSMPKHHAFLSHYLTFAYKLLSSLLQLHFFPSKQTLLSRFFVIPFWFPNPMCAFYVYIFYFYF